MFNLWVCPSNIRLTVVKSDSFRECTKGVFVLVKFDYFWQLAGIACDVAGLKRIAQEWIYAQWAHESDDFSSELCRQYYNVAGLTQKTPNDLPQPDGSFYYRSFSHYVDFACAYGRYLRLYVEDGISEARSLYAFVCALKHGQYFSDSIENYMKGVERYVEE